MEEIIGNHDEHQSGDQTNSISETEEEEFGTEFDANQDEEEDDDDDDLAYWVDSGDADDKDKEEM